MKIKKILLPVDGSDGSLIALETARDMAKKFDAQIILLNVVEIGFRGSMYEFYAYDPAVEESLVDRGCRILDDTEARFAKSGYKAPIHSDRKIVKDEKNQKRYEYHTNINLDHGDIHHPASAGEDPMFEGTEFAKKVEKEQHHDMHETQIKEGKLYHPAGTGEDPDFEGTQFDQADKYKSQDGHDNAGYRTDDTQNKKDEDDSVYMSRNDQMLREDKKTDKPFTEMDTHPGPISNPQNMGDQGYFNSDVDPKIERTAADYETREPKSDHNSAVPERRGPVGVENSPRINTDVSPELEGDIHPNQNPDNTQGHDDIVIKKVSLSGQPGETIVDFSDKHNIDLIVMATRSSSKVRRFFVGSTTNYVLHHSRVPLLAIPVKDDEKEDEKK